MACTGGSLGGMWPLATKNLDSPAPRQLVYLSQGQIDGGGIGLRKVQEQYKALNLWKLGSLIIIILLVRDFCG